MGLENLKPASEGEMAYNAICMLLMLLYRKEILTNEEMHNIMERASKGMNGITEFVLELQKKDAT